MRKIKILLLTLGVLNIFFAISPAPASAQRISVSFQVFYNQLSPYGQWVDDPDYGFIWIPDAGPDFFPYATNGHWIFTNYGWTWVSDFAWGWAPFHYGRWGFDVSFGWYWIPDEIWGPAWVVWRSGNGYYGWAPMPPWGRRDFYDRTFRIPPQRWIFVPHRYFGREDLHRHFVRRGDVLPIFRNTVIIHNTNRDRNRNVTYMSGPRREDVERATGRNIRQFSITDSERPGQNLREDRLQIYRPDVRKNIIGERRPTPPKFYDSDDFRERSKRDGRREQPAARQSDSPQNIQRGQKQGTGNEQRRQQGGDIAPQTRDQRREQPAARQGATPSDVQRKQRQDSVTPPAGDEKREQPAARQGTSGTQRKQTPEPAKETEKQEEERKSRRR